MNRVYFDITDIIQFAGRSTRLTGIQRVVFNIVTLLSRQHGGERVRCVYYDRSRQSMFEADLSSRPLDPEFDAEALLMDLGLAREPGFLPTTVRIKSYLRNHARNKLHRVLLKMRLYLWSCIDRQRLRDLDLLPAAPRRKAAAAIVPVRIEELPAAGHLVHLGSSWFFPEVWRFSAEHRARGGDVVQFVHDLIPVTHPQYMPEKEPPVFSNWLNHALNYATRFPCNSRFTAQALVDYAGGQRKAIQVDVIPLAHEFIGHGRRDEIAVPPRLTWMTGRSFVLCVGTLEARKNGLSLIRAWRSLVADLNGTPPMLVFAGRYGKIGGGALRQEIADQSRCPGGIFMVDMPSDNELAWLYRNCLFTAYPSFVEGWGLPVGESAWFGKYCVASSASSIPEVCGSLLDYVDPDDDGSIRSALLQCLSDNAFLRSREQAVAAASLRTWSDVADDLFAYVTG